MRRREARGASKSPGLYSPGRGEARVSRHPARMRAGLYNSDMQREGALSRVSARTEPAGSALPILVAAALLLGPARLPADIIHLKSGETIEGATSPGSRKGTLEVRKGNGSVVVLSESDIVRIEKRKNPLEEFEERLGGLPPGEMEPLLDLLVWAREKGLHAKVKVVARKVLEIDAHNELARKELGYVVHDNRWILESELRKKKGLIRFRGEWMAEEEKTRRLSAEAIRDVEDLLHRVESGNAYIQEFAIQQILASKEPGVRGVLASRIADPRIAVRMVAMAGLANFPAKNGDAEAARIVADLHRVALAEEKEEVKKVLRIVLRKFHRRESFRLALGTATSAASEAERRRAAWILGLTISKAGVPELCRALEGPGGAGRVEIRDVLRGALGVDHGYDREAWLRWWAENKARFKD
jgi:hypothetical protein